jgi:hypothetical protein
MFVALTVFVNMARTIKLDCILFGNAKAKIVGKVP